MVKRYELSPSQRQAISGILPGKIDDPGRSGVDSLGRPLRFILTDGERNDCTQALDLIKGFNPSYVLADKGYDTTEIVEAVEDLGAIAVIPPRKSWIHQRHYDKAIYKRRNLVERTFGKLKQF